MARANETVAALLQEYADLLSITGGDAFKARVYEKAARAVGGHHADVSHARPRQGLQKIPNVGKSIAEKIAGVPRHRPGRGRREAAAEDPGRGPGADRHARARAEEGHGPLPGARHLLDRRRWRPRSPRAACPACAASARRRPRTSSTASSFARGQTGRSLIDAAAGGRRGDRRGAVGRSTGCERLRLRRLAAPDAGDHRRHRHPGRRPLLARADGGVRRPAAGRRGPRARREEDLDPHHRRAAGRPAGGAAGVVGRGAAVLHRLQGAQRPGPRDRRPPGAQALRVRAVPGRRRLADRLARPRRRSTSSSAWPGSRRPCARTGARSTPPRRPARCPTW